MRDELEFAPRVLATGGIAQRVAELSRAIEVVDGLLTLEGLRIIHGRNAEKR
jgi:type III pantothenate kinase